jgi:hypothetical protein
MNCGGQKVYKKELFIQNVICAVSWTLMVSLVALTVVLVPFYDAGAATIKTTPRLSLKYNFNDNLYAQDEDDMDLSSASYIDYLVGISFLYQERRNTIEISGDAGYEQYVDLGGAIDDSDESPSDFSAMTIHGGILFRHIANKQLTYEIKDDIVQTRDLGEVFGAGTDSIGYWSLYISNVVSGSVIYQPSSKMNILGRYQYDTIVFEDPEADQAKPADSTEHRGVLRTEYSFSGKTTGIADFQFASRVFEETDNQEYADYNLIQGMVGVRYKLNSKSNIEALGGWAQRTFTDLADEALPSPPYPPNETRWDLDDMADPLAKIKFTTIPNNKLRLSLSADQGISTYGQNYFFTYTTGAADVRYDFTQKLYTNITFDYRQSTYDNDRNDYDWFYEDDRVDVTTQAKARLHYDILQKNNEGTLSVEGGYIYRSRDSSIDADDDYNANIPVLNRISQDSVVNTYYIQLQVLPSIIMGN